MSGHTTIAEIRDAAAALTSLRAPDDAWTAIASRITAGDVVMLPLDRTTRPDSAGGIAEGRSAASIRRVAAAAAIMLAAAGGAAALLRPDLVRVLLERLRVVPEAPAVVTLPAIPAVAPPAPTQLVLNGDVDLDVHLNAAGPNLTLRVRVGTTDEALVRATGFAAAAQFRRGRNDLTITNAASGEIDVTLPRGRHVTRVLVDGTAWIEQKSGSIRIFAPAADTAGPDFIIAVPSRSGAGR